jgi:hypothetical protein
MARPSLTLLDAAAPPALAGMMYESVLPADSSRSMPQATRGEDT